jgi:hypothetical protein
MYLVCIGYSFYFFNLQFTIHLMDKYLKWIKRKKKKKIDL